MNISLRTFFFAGTAVAGSFLLTGCGGSSDDASADGLTKIVLQTDWYAQAEHGGFYQALAEGYYEEAGLDVTIQQGGPNAMGAQKLITGRVDFTIGRVDDAAIQASRDLPIVVVSSFMQHDPQAFMVHAASGVETFEDLDGKSVMTTPGSALIRFLENTYDIQIEVIPLDYGMSRFIADPDFIQQCFITNEPFYLRKNGVDYRLLPMSDSGFDPYRVIVTTKRLTEEKPEVVRAFVAASIKGWRNYISGPNEKANELIKATNPKMTDDFIAFGINSMREAQLVGGRTGEDLTGMLDPVRIEQQLEIMANVDMLADHVTAAEIAPTTFLPPYLQEKLKTD